VAFGAFWDEFYKVGSVVRVWVCANACARFQLVVLSAYKQIRAQSVDVLSDIDEDGFERAFTMFRPGASHHFHHPML
jgi:hypothetical protein